MKTYIAIGGLVIKENKVLLVKQVNSFHDEAYWSLPGGKVEFGEDIICALKRELYEETGLKVNDQKLLFTSQVYHKNKEMRVFGFNFLITNWEGSISVNDPDNHVVNASFFNKEKAIELLKKQPWNSSDIINFIQHNKVEINLPYHQQ